MGSPANTDALFQPAPDPAAQDLSRESDGGVVCELRKTWRELESIRSGIESNWPSSQAKHSRIASLKRMQAVLAEAGKRLKSHINKAPTSNVGDEGF